MMRPPARRFPIGLELVSPTEAHARVWAPASKSAAVELYHNGSEPEIFPLQPEPGGYFSGGVKPARAGLLYRIRLDSGSFPDPASRFQPEGPHGPSQIVDPAFDWSDQAWRGRAASEIVGYELHLGTFSPEGTWRGAMEKLPRLVELGITMVEVMPIADFPGKFGWGYDGVNYFAPCRLYGSPHDAKAFVNRAHELGLMVILDVVYNHLGPDGNYLGQFTKTLNSSDNPNDWGDAINFDGPGSAGVREFFITNAAYWISEFHFDGLRLDATHQIYDRSTPHVLAEIGRAARIAGAGREIYVVAETESQESRLVRPEEQGGMGLTSMWNDDFHHAAIVAATGRGEAYLSDYRGSAQEFVSLLKHGFLYQGQLFTWQQKRRGQPAFDLPGPAFTVFLENHDQVSNFVAGRRLHQLTSPGRFRALTAVLLLGPQTPLLFQGQEWAATTPFVFFADHAGELRGQVHAGRAKFLTQFRSLQGADISAHYLDPGSADTVRRCQLDWTERERHAWAVQLHAELLRLRRDTPALRAPVRVDGAVLGAQAFVLRYFAEGRDRLLLVNLGPDLRLAIAPEPLLAPWSGQGWEIEWSSEAVAYGGRGTAPLETAQGWLIPGEAAVLLRPSPDPALPPAILTEKG